MATATQARRRRPPQGGAKLVRGIETFAAGSYPGDAPGETWDYSPADIATIARNFAVLSRGQTPLHTVPVVRTHDEVHAYGTVAGADADGELLTTDWQDVEPGLAADIRAKKLLKVSAEIKRDFADKDGKIIAPGPYLYRIAVLGADVPRVKGLRDLPADQFRDREPGRRFTRRFKFADPAIAPPRVSTMTREQAVQFLTEMGIDPAAMGPDVPDAFIIAVATAWQDEEDLEPADAGAAGTPPRKTMMDDGTPAGGARPPKKVSVVQTYADPKAIRKLIAREVATATAAATKVLNDAAAAETAARFSRAAEERQAAVRLFCDQRAKDNKLTPAENDEGNPTSVRARLVRLAAQAPVTHSFADPKDKAKTISKTELELQQEEIDARPARKFSERVTQGGGSGEGSVTDTGASADYARRTKEYWEKRGQRAGAAANN